MLMMKKKMTMLQITIENLLNMTVLITIIEFWKTAKQQNTLTGMQTNQKLRMPLKTSTKALMMGIRMVLLFIDICEKNS